MKRFSRNLIVCSAFLSICSAANLSYARGEGAGAAAAAGAAGMRAGLSAIAAKAQTTGVAADDAANAGLASNTGPTGPAAATVPVSPCQPPTLRDGWYIGVQGGYGTYQIRNSIDFLTGTPLYNMNPVTANSNWSIGGVIGYGKMINNWFYLGAEFLALANTMEEELIATNLAFPYTNQSAAGPTYGIGFLPGIKLTNETLVYMRLGWNRMIMKTNETLSVLTPVNVSKSLDGFALGVGMETLITGNYSVRGEYGHVFLSTYNTAGYFNTKVSPAYDGFAVTFIYHA